MKKLYTPVKINGLEIKNRVLMSPMSVGHTVDGFIDDSVPEFFRKRAEGGVGLIVFANMQWDPVRYNPIHGAMLTDEKYIPQLKKLTTAIHEGGSKVFAQMMHRGTSAPRAAIQGEQAVGPSAVPRKFTHYEMPRELTIDEIHQFVQWQAKAAKIAKDAGFDGIEIETNSGYLYGQFWSPVTNLREDEYGRQNLENCNRFMVETLTAIREVVGKDYPIQLRVGGSDLVKGGCNGDDIAEICEYLDKTGMVDSFSLTAGWHDSTVPLITMEVPYGNWNYLGRQIKAKVKAPVFMGVRQHITLAEEEVERGDFDGVVIGRQWLAEPNLVKKAMNGEYDRIRPCVGCNALCLDAAQAGKPIGCIGNYECNKEGTLVDANGKFPSEVKSEHPEKILVIGAGPAGMEFARVSALRGHKVTIWEKRNRTIGLSLYAATPPRRYDIRYLGQWMERECRTLGVEIILNKEATTEDILAASKDFDRVVIAAGSRAVMPPIPTEEGADVVHAWDVFEGKVSLGKNVVVVGGGDVGVEVAMTIAEVGTITAEQLRFMMIYETEPAEKLKELLVTGIHKVSVVEMGSKFAPDINPGSRWSIMYRTKQLGVNLLKETKVLEIKKDAVVVENADGKQSIPADTVVVAAGAKPNNALYEELKDKLPKVDVIGDSVSVGRIHNAVESAYKLAMTI
jgi:2,4-dienoyl-CoA reductase (NADPH2)